MKKSILQKDPKLLNLTSFSMKIIAAINQIRASPRKYIKEIQSKIKFSEENPNEFEIFSQKFFDEGKKSLTELLEFLSTEENLPSLTIKNGLISSSDNLMKILILHEGINDASGLPTQSQFLFEKRVNKYGIALGEINELISLGIENPEAVVFNFILCSGDEIKRERNVIFSQNMKFVGAISEFLPCEKLCSILNFAEHYFDMDEGVPQHLLFKYQPNMYKQVTQTNRNQKNDNNIKLTVTRVKDEPQQTYKKPLVKSPQTHSPNRETQNAEIKSNNKITSSKNNLPLVIKTLPYKSNKTNEDDDDDEEIDDEEFDRRKEKRLEEIRRSLEEEKEVVNIGEQVKGEFNFDEEDESVINDPFVEKIKISSQDYFDEVSKTNKNFMKKIIFYKDGTTQTMLYKKN